MKTSKPHNTLAKKIESQTDVFKAFQIAVAGRELTKLERSVGYIYGLAKIQVKLKENSHW